MILARSSCFAILIFLTNYVSSQHLPPTESRFIAVTGSAELSIPPDEIELRIRLQSFQETDLKRVSLAEVESRFKDILRNNGIDPEQTIISNQNSYWYSWWQLYRNDGQSNKLVQVRLDTSTDLLALMKELDFPGVASLNITDKSNKHIQELRREVKIAALRAARDKAAYMLESIDEELGQVISIEEMPEQSSYRWRSNTNFVSNAVVGPNQGTRGVENVSAIKLRYEVKARFSIR